MNVMQCANAIMNNANMEPTLPQFWNSCIECQTGFVASHDMRNRSRRWDIHEKMTVIRHDDEPIQKKWMELLDAVEAFHGLTCVGRISKEWHSVSRDRGHQHDPIATNRVALRHGTTVAPHSSGAEMAVERKIRKCRFFRIGTTKNPFH